MKKITTTLLFLTIGNAVYLAQVGINTDNPQTTFHIDGAKDNPSTGAPIAAQQANDIAITSAGNVGIGTTVPSTKLDIVSSTAGALKIADGTQGDGKILVSDANGVATWQNSSPAVIINSSTGGAISIAGTLTYLGAAATVTIPGYYLISPKLITDYAPANCSAFIAYNLSTNSTTLQNAAFPLQEAHFASTLGTNNFIYSTNVAYLTAATYYMLVRYGASSPCTSHISRNTASQNSFTLTLLK
ncbi:hypothetical protein ASG22_08875 [Chryseobacterium sp. Leaf405]|uniref:hypothetical protein n=1 Tax=Chryseobacterium sp. Leaf405 TaxID=1736367 RepID=UPI0006FA5DE4|nr:hypothetical protein [Chryseobacterium sp. Leaf405]KQT24119.1 hypothetical protein ASG22_08875 [Chryseobacterium sp. Leaf405]